MGATIRKVPEKWNHPKRIKNQFQMGGGYRIEEQFVPMHQGDFKEAVKEWKKDLKNWYKGQEYWSNGLYWSSWFKEEPVPIKEKFKDWLDSIEEDRIRHNFSTDYREEEKQKYITGICSYEDIAGEPPRPPNPDDYMPKGEWIQLFENVSEGTPLTPPFETAPELIDWLANNKDFWGRDWTREQAEAMVRDEYAPSMTVINGKVHNTQESLVV